METKLAAGHATVKPSSPGRCRREQLPASFCAPYWKKLASCRQCQHTESNLVRIFVVSPMGCAAQRGFRNFRNFRTPFAMGFGRQARIASRVTPNVASPVEGPTTDFFGAAAGPMAFARRRKLVVGRIQHGDRVAVTARDADGIKALLMAYLGLFVRIEVNPE
jgi:hypothetical protein